MNTKMDSLPVRSRIVPEIVLDGLCFPVKWCVNYVDIKLAHAQYGSTRLSNPWNRKKLAMKHVTDLEYFDMAFFDGDDTVDPNTYPFLRCLSGSWKNYEVLEPIEEVLWHVGWVSGKHAAVSKITLTGAVKVLIGPGDVYFFGIDAQSKTQIPIVNTGSGNRLHEGEHAHIPLL